MEVKNFKNVDYSIVKTLYPDNEIQEIAFQTNIFPGDIVSFKEKVECPAELKANSKALFDTKTIKPEHKWLVNSVNIHYNMETCEFTTTIDYMTELKREDCQLTGWAKGVDVSMVNIVEKHTGAIENFENKVYMPFKYGDIVWRFPNHLYDSFTPIRYKIIGMNYRLGGVYHKDGYFQFQNQGVNINALEWCYNKCINGYGEYGFMPTWGACNLVGYSYKRDCTIKEEEPGLYDINAIKKEFIDYGNLPKFARATWRADYFHDSPFVKPIYEALCNDLGITMEDLEEASHKIVPKTKPKKKPSKPRAKKSNKVKDMFACMTEKEKKEMLKLLQNG